MLLPSTSGLLVARHVGIHPFQQRIATFSLEPIRRMNISSFRSTGCPDVVARARQRSQVGTGGSGARTRRAYSTRPGKDDSTTPSAPATPKSTAIETNGASSSSEPTPAPARPVISPSLIPFCSESPLNYDIVPAPPAASSPLKAAIADFYASGRAGDIEVPAEDLHWGEKLWKSGKALFKFYWGGMKLLWRNIGDMRVLKNQREVQGWTLTRREIRFIERTNGDLYRLIPFVLVLAILEELLPLLVLYAPWLLPSTTVLPSQLLRIKWDEEQRRKEALVGLGRWRSIVLPDPSADVPRGRVILDRKRGVHYIEDEETNALCKSLDLGTRSPWWWLRRRLGARLEWLRQDDELLRREENGLGLTNEEKRLALAHRGILSLATPSSSLQSSLDSWLSFASPLSDPKAVHEEMLAKMIDEADRAYRGSEEEKQEKETAEEIEEKKGGRV